MRVTQTWKKGYVEGYKAGLELAIELMEIIVRGRESFEQAAEEYERREADEIQVKRRIIGPH